MTTPENEQAPKALVYTVEEAAALLGLCKSAAYEAVKKGDIPAVRFGRRWVVPKAKLHEKLGLESEEPKGK